MTIPGLTTISTASSFDEAVRKLEKEIAARGMSLFARIIMPPARPGRDFPCAPRCF